MKHTALLIIALFFAVQNTCNAQNNSKPVTRKETDKSTNTKVKKEKKVKTENNLKVLASGSYSEMEEPFIFVARDKESLEKLKNLPINNIEIKEEIDFEKNVVVAAFAGTMRTGGYEVEITGTDSKVSVNLDSPPKDAMVTQALTQPFSVVLVPLKNDESLNLEVSDYWKDKAENYSVKTGSVEFSGGIAGIRQRFDTEGSIRVYRLNKFVTMIFDIKGKDKESGRKFSDVISVELADDSLKVENITGGNLIERPHPPMKLDADFSADKISVMLITQNEKTSVSDGFTGKAVLEAVKN